MAEETLCDSEAMRRFAGIELGDDRIPDVEGTVAPVGPRKPRGTILNFRRLPERHGLTQAIFADMNAASGRQGHHAALGHPGGCEQANAIGSVAPAQDHRCAVLDQEQVRRTRPRGNRPVAGAVTGP